MISSFVSNERSSKLLEPMALHAPSTVMTFWCSRVCGYSNRRTPHRNSFSKLRWPACCTMGLSEPLVDGIRTRTSTPRFTASPKASEHADVSQPPLVKEHHPATRVAHLLDDGFARVLRAQRVQEYPHLDARSRSLDEPIGHTPAERALLPQECLEVHGFSRRPEAAEQDIEEGAVLMHLHLVAGQRGAQRQARERRH